MQQIKLFRGLDSELPRLQDQINRWLAESGARVIQMSGNLSPQSVLQDPKGAPPLSPLVPSEVLVTILYEAQAAAPQA